MGGADDGLAFSFIYCLIGLGLIGIDINAASDYFDARIQAAQKKGTWLSTAGSGEPASPNVEALGGKYTAEPKGGGEPGIGLHGKPPEAAGGVALNAAEPEPEPEPESATEPEPQAEGEAEPEPSAPKIQAEP